MCRVSDVRMRCVVCFFFLMNGRPPRSTQSRSSAASDVYKRQTAQAVDVLQKVYKCYMDTDASLVEINPLILEGNGNIKALDAKFNFDANALFLSLIHISEPTRPS